MTQSGAPVEHSTSLSQNSTENGQWRQGPRWNMAIWGKRLQLKEGTYLSVSANWKDLLKLILFNLSEQGFAVLFLLLSFKLLDWCPRSSCNRVRQGGIKAKEGRSETKSWAQDGNTWKPAIPVWGYRFDPRLCANNPSKTHTKQLPWDYILNMNQTLVLLTLNAKQTLESVGQRIINIVWKSTSNKKKVTCAMTVPQVVVF